MFTLFQLIVVCMNCKSFLKFFFLYDIYILSEFNYACYLVSLLIPFHKGAMLLCENFNMTTRFFFFYIHLKDFAKLTTRNQKSAQTIVFSSMLVYPVTFPLAAPYLVYMFCAWLAQMGQEITGSAVES